MPLDEYHEDYVPPPTPVPIPTPPENLPRRWRSPRKRGKEAESSANNDTSDDKPLERVVKKIHVQAPSVDVQTVYRTLRRSGREGSGRYLSVNIRLS